jgi:hypothetical protein
MMCGWLEAGGDLELKQMKTDKIFYQSLGIINFFTYLYYVIKDRYKLKDMEKLIGQFVNVTVSKDGKTATKLLKVCKVKARSVLFIEVDKENRKNIFRKVKTNDITPIGLIGHTQCFSVKEGVLPDKWESEWDNIGNFSRMAAGSFGYTPRPNYSNHSKGWASNSAHFRT